jgi:hypothetical protein
MKRAHPLAKGTLTVKWQTQLARVYKLAKGTPTDKGHTQLQMDTNWQRAHQLAKGTIGAESVLISGNAVKLSENFCRILYFLGSQDQQKGLIYQKIL